MNYTRDNRVGFNVRSSVLGALGIAAFLSISGPALAEDSNRNEVRESLERDGWRVIWGKNFTEGDWVRGTQAIAESVASDNPGPFLAWFSDELQQNFAKIEANLSGVSEQELRRWVAQSLREKRVIRYRGLLIDAGFATYNRWQREVHDEPRIRFKGLGSTVEMVRVENHIPLPNWHQFYVRYKLIPEGGTDPQQARDHYEIVVANQTREKLTVYVRYREPNDRWSTGTYSLAPGEKSGINAPTRNRWIGFHGESPTREWEGRNDERHWKVNVRNKPLQFRVVDMGEKIGHFTYTFR